MLENWWREEMENKKREYGSSKDKNRREKMDWEREWCTPGSPNKIDQFHWWGLPESFNRFHEQSQWRTRNNHTQRENSEIFIENNEKVPLPVAGIHAYRMGWRRPFLAGL